MLHALHLANAICVFGKVERVIVRTEEQIAAHARGQIQHNVGITFANASDHLSI